MIKYIKYIIVFIVMSCNAQTNNCNYYIDIPFSGVIEIKSENFKLGYHSINFMRYPTKLRINDCNSKNIKLIVYKDVDYKEILIEGNCVINDSLEEIEIVKMDFETLKEERRTVKAYRCYLNGVWNFNYFKG